MPEHVVESNPGKLLIADPLSGVRGRQSSKPPEVESATTANFAIITLVGYLVLVNLKPILMPLAIAVLFYFLIRAPEQYLIERFDVVARMPMLAYGVLLALGALASYGISILLYRNIDQFKDEMNKEGGLIEKFERSGPT
ncbi:MAG: hypothetical protein Ct9H90mP24_5380 [Methanobacteriota archaeon]|nr:MAG: hypothetical protein Ct9H90mP24_5380 [Euryarchaeota archaeon]